MRRVYARVLRFLLARYGGDADSQTDEDAERPAGKAALCELAPVGEGKPARDAAAIGSVLETIHRQISPGVPAGPLQHGLPPDQPIAAAAFREVAVAECFQAALFRQRIGSRVVQLGRTFRLEVALRDLPRAKELLPQPSSEWLSLKEALSFLGRKEEPASFPLAWTPQAFPSLTSYWLANTLFWAVAAGFGGCFVLFAIGWPQGASATLLQISLGGAAFGTLFGLIWGLRAMLGRKPTRP